LPQFIGNLSLFQIGFCQKADIVWEMRLRLDLVNKLTEADLLREVLANNHRYKPEPNFSKTGVGTAFVPPAPGDEL
jgi:hypothetical protein